MSMDDFDEIYDDIETVPCPACGGVTRARRCDVCGGEGVRDYNDAPEEWGEDCPSEKNHLITCRHCDQGVQRWCTKCGADYWQAARKASAK